MNGKRIIARLPLLTASIVVALLLLAGTYTVIAKSAPPPAGPALASTSDGARTFWTSGWKDISPGDIEPFTHSLGGNLEDYAVELWFKDTDGNLGINRFGYGGLVAGTQGLGAHWQHLTTDTVQVFRGPQDVVADQVRINVWIHHTSTQAYSSTWVTIDPGKTEIFTHGLAVTATDLTVNLWFSSTDLGIHHFAYGGLSVNPLSRTLGAFWRNLTNNTIQVHRFVSDTVVEQVRVEVVAADEPPDYDSLVALGGWQPLTPGSPFVFTHNLGWSTDMLIIQGECRDATGPNSLGIHQKFAGGNHHWTDGWQGTHLQNVTTNTVTILRRLDDIDCPLARVRVIKRSRSLYLPVIMRDQSSP